MAVIQTKRFPDDFYFFGNADTYIVPDNEIQERVQKVKKILKKQEKENPRDYSPCYIQSGDTIVLGMRENDHKTILVCKKFYQLDYSFKD